MSIINQKMFNVAVDHMRKYPQEFRWRENGTFRRNSYLGDNDCDLCVKGKLLKEGYLEGKELGSMLKPEEKRNVFDHLEAIYENIPNNKYAKLGTERGLQQLAKDYGFVYKAKKKTYTDILNDTFELSI